MGDFVVDAIGDHEFPDVGTWDELWHYLLWHTACPDAFKAGYRWWRAYEAQRP